MRSIQSPLDGFGSPFGRRSGAALAFGSLGTDQPLFATLGAGTFAPTLLQPVQGVLTAVRFAVKTPGTYSIIACSKVSPTQWVIDEVWPGTTEETGAGVTILAGEGVIPSGHVIPANGFVGVLIFGTMRIGYGSLPGNTWMSFNGTVAVGNLLTRTANANNFEIGIAYDYLYTPQPAFVPLSDRLPDGVGPNVYSLGDSTIAAHLSQSSVMGFIDSGKTEIDLSVPGDTINEQLADWNALTVVPEDVGWVIVQVGLNDMYPAEAASVAIARLQNLVDTIRSDVGSAPIIISQMTPARERYIDVYGGTNGPIAHQKWLDMNEAIAGGGATPITGVDARVTAHVPLMNDGAGNLLPLYDMGDHIHEDNLGRQVIARAWENAIVAAVS